MICTWKDAFQQTACQWLFIGKIRLCAWVNNTPDMSCFYQVCILLLTAITWTQIDFVCRVVTAQSGILSMASLEDWTPDQRNKYRISTRKKWDGNSDYKILFSNEYSTNTECSMCTTSALWWEIDSILFEVNQIWLVFTIAWGLAMLKTMRPAETK